MPSNSKCLSSVLFIVFTPLLFAFLYTIDSYASPPKIFYIEKVHKDHLDIAVYTITDHTSYTFSNIDLDSSIVGKENPFNLIYYSLESFGATALEQGSAVIKPQASPTVEELQAQEKAKKEKKGIWQASSSKDSPVNDSNTPRQDNSSSLSSWLKNCLSMSWQFVRQWFTYLVSIGAMALLCQYLYKKFYIQRKLLLLLIGEPFSGKTALCLRLLDPGIDKKRILGLSPSKALIKVKKNSFIPIGKFEIYPCLSDVPGANFATVWDEFKGSKAQAVVLVLSPTQGNTINPSDALDPKYIYTQLGYVQAYIEGGMGSKTTWKPKCIIVFINKFDLFSRLPPDDSSSLDAVEKVELTFDDHIKSAKVAGEKAGIKVHILHGSALENWNCARIIDIIGHTLYGY